MGDPGRLDDMNVDTSLSRSKGTEIVGGRGCARARMRCNPSRLSGYDSVSGKSSESGMIKKHTDGLRFFCGSVSFSTGYVSRFPLPSFEDMRIPFGSEYVWVYFGSSASFYW